MTVSLSAHHLLCILTYVGKGYTPKFVANYDAIVARLNAGEEVRIITGPDDICGPLLDGADPHCRNESVAERDAQAGDALAEILGRRLDTAGSPLILTGDRLAAMREAFRTGAVRKACARCEWATLCTSVAGSDFAGTRLLPG